MFAPDTERAGVAITWRGGQTTRHEIVRSVSRYESLGEYDRMMDRIVQLRREGLTIKEMAAQLTREGYRTPRSQKGYTPTSVRQLLSRRGLTGGAIGREQLESGEWWLPDLAQRARDLLRQASRLGTARGSSCTASSAGRSVGCLGRRPGTTAVAEAHGKPGVKTTCMDH